MNKNFISIDQIIVNYKLQDYIHNEHYAQIDLVELKKDTILFHQDEFPEYFYIFLEGKLRVYQICSNGKMIILNTCKQPKILGEVELLSNQPTLSYVDLIKDSKLLQIPMDYCRNVMLKDMDFLTKTSLNLAKALYRTQRNNVINLSLSLEDRLASYILALEKDGYFEVDLKELSAMLGTTYRHIQRVFSKFRDLGYVTVHDHGYLITNLEGLENHNLDDYIF